ncbi:rhomboid family intramembrane serine protease [Rubellimicrobium arenae]|uniref:rhomboid family intramembrane serine protease n=1 Tax=Rubellimicrobium arenae TaxID=2817372 RepID=UPI001FEE9A9A|nr:rhomboid family intramembrane serine protease [Rubellimicrobium arenae]
MARSFLKPLPDPSPGERPVNPVPPVVVALFLVIMGIEAALSLGGTGMVGGPAAVGWRVALIDRFAFSPAVFDYVVEGGRREAGFLIRFVSYAFVHGSVTHALFAGALLLALGKFVGEGMGQLAALAVFLLSTVGGAVAFGALLDGLVPLFGCYPGVYGLIGAFTYLLWLRLGLAGENRLRAFRLIGTLLAFQLLFGMLFGANPIWVADVGGFVVGLAVATILAPGGWAALRARLRAR